MEVAEASLSTRKVSISLEDSPPKAEAIRVLASEEERASDEVQKYLAITNHILNDQLYLVSNITMEATQIGRASCRERV